MATGPDAGDETYWEADTAQAAPREETGPEPDRHPELAGVDLREFEHAPPSEPWRLRHLMYLVAVVAVLMWVGILVFASIVIGTFLVAGFLLVLFAAVMGAGVIRRAGDTPGKTRCSRSWPSRRNGACRWLLRSWPSPISSAVSRTGGS